MTRAAAPCGPGPGLGVSAPNTAPFPQAPGGFEPRAQPVCQRCRAWPNRGGLPQRQRAHRRTAVDARRWAQAAAQATLPRPQKGVRGRLPFPGAGDKQGTGQENSMSEVSRARQMFPIWSQQTRRMGGRQAGSSLTAGMVVPVRRARITRQAAFAGHVTVALAAPVNAIGPARAVCPP